MVIAFDLLPHKAPERSFYFLSTLTLLYTVKITLTPLGQGEKQNHRTITVTPETSSIHVGRASQNPIKGLLAAPDNAWFEYPILSRNHAKFTASHRDLVS